MATTETKRPSPEGEGLLDQVKTFDNVNRLDSIKLIDGSPEIAVVGTAINYDMSSINSTDFKDRVAFQETAFTEETKALEQLAELLRRGEEFISMLYTFRSASKALPMVQTDTPEHIRNEIHRTTFQILRPDALKLKELMQFQEQAVKVLKENIERLIRIEQKKQAQSEEVLDHLVKCVNMLIVLDALKDMKACLLNDFSRYKRAFHAIRADLPESDVMADEIHNLQWFLGNPSHPHNFIMHNLKEMLHKLGGFDLVLIALMNHCADTIDQKRFLLPEEEHTFYRVIPFLVYLLDTDADNPKLSAFKHKGVNLSRFQKLFRHHPVVPLYGDMRIDVLFILRRCKYWDEASMGEAWQSKRKEKLEAQYLLHIHRARFRTEYTKITMEVTHLLNVIKSHHKKNVAIPAALFNSVFDTIRDAFRALCSWSGMIKRNSAWKYAHPISPEEYKRLGGKSTLDNIEYEKVVRFNYTEDELYALIDVIGMIKGLGNLLMQNELLLVPLIRRSIHDKFQVFLQKEVARPLRKAFKRSRKDTLAVMLQMRDIGGDWFNYKEQKEDYKQPKKVLVEVNRDFPRRSTAPTLTQITLVRRMMHTIFSPKSSGMQGGLFAKNDLKKEWIPVWEEFFATGFFFKYLLDYAQILREITDMSHLWYREFYLEMTKQVQFPIDLSMPWLLTEFLIKTPSMKENIFFPMDIYNDAAARALSTLRQQFLYDEIEAELNLSFDQLVYHLSEDVFKYFKTVASSVLIDKSYEKQFFNMKRKASDVVNSRYTALLFQRHIQLLGRSINLNLLISEHINSYLRRNIDFVIRNFESRDLTSIVGLRYGLLNVRLTHALLADYLTVDPWEKMFKEINEDVNIGQFRGRILWHVFSELISDIIPNYVYNSNTQRFVRGPINFVEDAVRERPPSNVQPWFWYGKGFKEAFEREAAICRGYFGVEHMEALLTVLDYQDVPLIIHEVVTDISNKTVNDFGPYAQTITAVIPPMKLPSLFYGVVGGYGYFEIKLTQIGKYSALRSGVFQMLREIGNTVLFVRLLETCIKKLDDFAFQHQAFFAGIQPIPPKKQQPTGTGETKVLDIPFVLPTTPSPVTTIIQRTCSLLASKGDTETGLLDYLSKAAASAPELYVFQPDNMSMLTAALQRLSKNMQDAKLKDQWKGNPAKGDDIINVDEPNDIIRLWSVLLFLFCKLQKGSADAPAVDDMTAFGEGFLWAGNLLIHLMGYRSRFEFSDFNYHIIKLAALKPLPPESDGKEKKKKKEAAPTPADALIPDARAFLRNAVALKAINESIFGCLDTFFPVKRGIVFQLHPPDKDPDDGAIPVRRLSLLPGADAKGEPRGTMLVATPSKATLPTAGSASHLSVPSTPGGGGGETPQWGEDAEYGGGGEEGGDGGGDDGGGDDIPDAPEDSTIPDSAYGEPEGEGIPGEGGEDDEYGAAPSAPSSSVPPPAPPPGKPPTAPPM